MAGRARQILFRIFYSTSFTVVFLLLIAFSCAAPIDTIYQSYKRGRLIDIFLITGVYVVTGLAALFLYASRLYTNRSVLKDIPKNFMPLDKNELPGKRIWRLIEDCKSRSAVIAYQARPRSRRIENELPYARERIETLLKPEHSKKPQIFEPQWGTIAHPGWSSPASSELPNLEYAKVVSELTDLIEARAVSMAPTDPLLTPAEDEIPPVNSLIIEALSRPEEFGMRLYIIRLIALEMLEDNSLVTTFITMYERARFASEPLSEIEFQALMRMFAEVLRTMKPPALDVLGLDDSDIRSGAQLNHFANAQRKVSSSNSSFTSAGSVRKYSRRRSDVSDASHEGDSGVNNADEVSLWTAPTSRPPFTSRSTSRRMPSSQSGEGSRHSRLRLYHARSQNSMLSAKSGRSQRSDTGSVIVRLNPNIDGQSSTLPYTIQLPSSDR